MALKNISLNIMRGEICCIFGTSGSGKSTFLNQLAGMEKPTRGEVLIGGVPVSRLNENQLAAFRQRHIGFVFQSYNLLPKPDRHRECGPAPDVPGGPPQGAGGGRPPDALPGGTGTPAGPFSPPDVRRPAAARRHCPGLHCPAGCGLCRRAHRQPGFQNHGGDHGNDLHLCPTLSPDHHSGHPRPGDGRLRRPHRAADRRDHRQ